MEKRDMKNELNDLSVGSTFVWCGLIYEVKESTCCRDCSFYIPDHGCYCDIVKEDIPLCGGFLRRDEKCVVFVKVGEVRD